MPVRILRLCFGLSNYSIDESDSESLETYVGSVGGAVKVYSIHAHRTVAACGVSVTETLNFKQQQRWVRIDAR